VAVYNYIDETGVITVDAAAIQADVEAEYRGVFGADLIVTPNTPQGMLISAEVQARIALADNNAQLANQINPNLAGGVFLDAIMSLTNPYGRLPALQSVVYATITGTPGTVIPAGSIVAETGSGDLNQFYTLTQLTIPANGVATGVQFNSVVYGPIPCAVNALTDIVTAVLGWTTVTNSAAATVGRTLQSDLDARQYRLNTLATQGASTAQAITAEILRTTSASSVTLLENIANTTQTIDGVSMVAKSVYVCVNDSVVADQGTTSEVAAVITGTPAVVQTGTLTANSVTVTGLTDTTLFAVGAGIQGTGIALGTRVATKPSSTSITMTIAATASGAESLSFCIVVPGGSQASSNGYVFQTLGDVLIPASGTLDPVLFQALQTGPIPVPVNSLTVIVTPVSGWDTVNNTITAALGLPSNVAQAMVAKKSAGCAFSNGEIVQTGTLTASSITVTGLTDTSVFSVGALIKGTGIAAGARVATKPSSTSITMTIAATASGAQSLTFFAGTPISTIVDVPYSGQLMTVLYDIAASVTINVLVNIKLLGAVQDAVTAVQDAIVAYATGGISGIAGLTVGQNVSAFELAGAVTSQYPGIYVQSLYISTGSTSPTLPTEIAIAPYQIATITANNIIVNLV